MIHSTCGIELFVLTLEPFLRKVRHNTNISGLEIPGLIPQKFSAYADDLLLFITNPITTLPNLLQELRNYRELSNLKFKLNFQKSKALSPCALERLNH